MMGVGVLGGHVCRPCGVMDSVVGHQSGHGIKSSSLDDFFFKYLNHI